MPTLQAKDLTREVPRSPFEELGGFPWLPRMIDKVRALTAGTLGDYTPFPCGGDQRFLGALGVEPDAIKAVIASGASDEEVLAWVKSHAPEGLEGRIAAYKGGALKPVGPQLAEYLEGAKAELKQARPELDLSGIDNFSKLICIEEGHPIPQA